MLIAEPANASVVRYSSRAATEIASSHSSSGMKPIRSVSRGTGTAQVHSAPWPPTQLASAAAGICSLPGSTR